MSAYDDWLLSGEPGNQPDIPLSQAMREAAETLIAASERYEAYNPMRYEWSAADLLREADHVEAEEN